MKFECELDAHIAESMRDPEYASAHYRAEARYAVEDVVAARLAEHRHPGEMLTSLGEAWLTCGCGERIDLPIAGGIVNGEEAARLFESHVASVVAESLTEQQWVAAPPATQVFVGMSPPPGEPKWHTHAQTEEPQ